VKEPALTTPLALVLTVMVLVALENAPEAPLEIGRASCRERGTRLVDGARIVAVIVVPNAVLTVVLCGVPEVALMLLGAAAVLVSEMLGGVRPTVFLSVSRSLAATVFLVKEPALATPLPLVLTVMVLVVLENAPEAPL